MSISEIIVKVIGVILSIVGLLLVLAGVGIETVVGLSTLPFWVLLLVGLVMIGIGIYVIRGGGIAL